MSVVENHLQYWTKDPPSEVGIRVAELLDEWQGLHHFDSAAMKRVEWANTLFIEIKLPRAMSVGQLATFDFNQLTALVFLAHDHCIRIDVAPCNGSHVRLLFHPRRAREGGMGARHPTIEQALETWRRQHTSREIQPLATSQ